MFNNETANFNFYIVKSSKLTLRAKFNNKTANFNSYINKKQRIALEENCRYSIWTFRRFTQCANRDSLLVKIRCFLIII